jgi:hypothetical protein
MAQPPNVPIEAGAAVLVAGAFVKALPPLAAALAVVWYGIQIWQSETGRGWRMRWGRLFRRQLCPADYLAFFILGAGVAGAWAMLFELGIWMQ